MVWEVFIIPERLPLCPEVEFWKNETIFGISGSFVFFEASIIKSLKTPFKWNKPIINHQSRFKLEYSCHKLDPESRKFSS